MTEDMPKGAAHMTQHLDLLTDEPLELAIALRKLAEAKSGEWAAKGDPDPEWSKFAEVAAELVAELKALNEPGAAA